MKAANLPEPARGNEPNPDVSEARYLRLVPVIIHVDMDAFFASVEQLDDPSLRGRPVAVGGRSERGVVAAASYEAREFGVRSAMPMSWARRRCPELAIVTPRPGRYSDVSRQVFEIFRRYTPLVEGLSIDEAFLDVTGSEALFGDGASIAAKIRREIREELGLSASAGVAPNKFVAKIASDQNKPDGLTLVAEADVLPFLAALPIERMWGVGPKAAGRLHDFGFRTIGDLAASDAATLEGPLGSWGGSVLELARGRDSRPVVTGSPVKSVGSEHTFEEDLRSAEALSPRILAQSAKVAERLTRAGLWAHVITLKVKYADHTSRSRQRRLPEPLADTDSIHREAMSLLGRFEGLERGVRLTGVSASALSEEPPAPGLFPDEAKQRRERLERVTAELNARFGAQGITRGTLLDE